MTSNPVATIPVGTVMAYAGALTSTNVTTLSALGWLPCDGSLYATSSTGAYAALFAVLQTSCGGAGTTQFAVPDYRGVFLRGVDGGSTHDPDAGTRTPPRPDLAVQGAHGDSAGSLETSAIRSHTHDYWLNDSYGVMKELMDDLWSNSKSTVATAAAGGNETRPPNVYVNYIICYDNTGAGFAIPPGVIVPFAGDVAAMSSDDWLVCDGTPRSTTTYATLSGVVETAFGAGGGFFYVDLRGCFLRGVDNGKHRDPDVAARTAPQPTQSSHGNTGDAVGSFQTTQYLSHTHDISAYTTKSSSQTQGGTAGPIANHPDNDKITDPSYVGYQWGSSATGTGSEARPCNLSVYWLIKAT